MGSSTVDNYKESFSDNTNQIGCPKHGTLYLQKDHDSGEYVCTRDGYVIENSEFYEGPERRAFSSEEREERSRTGSPIRLSISDKGLSTLIDKKNKDYFGRDISQDQRTSMIRLRKWNIRSKFYSSKDRNLTEAMSCLAKYIDALGFPEDIKDSASAIYRKALDKGLVRGRSIGSIVAASTYAASRRTSNVQRPLNKFAEIAQLTLGVKKKELTRNYRLLVKELNLQQPLQDPKYYVNFLANCFDLSKVGPRANALVDLASKKRLTLGRNPKSTAAAVFYEACRESMEFRESPTQREIAEKVQLTEVTLRNRWHELTRELEL